MCWYEVTHERVLRSMIREGIKKYDTHIEPRSYKLELLGKLIV